jgi:hypothetical protein
MTDAERQELKDRLLMADLANKTADTAYKNVLVRIEPWKAMAIAFGAGAAVMGAAVGLVAAIFRAAGAH